MHGEITNSRKGFLLYGCVACGKNPKGTHSLPQQEVIDRLKVLYSDKYTYEKFKYVDSTTKVILTCPVHGDFEKVVSLLYQGYGCNACSKEYKKQTTPLKITTADFINRVEAFAPGMYTFEKTNYSGAENSVTVTCKVHGDFTKKANSFYVSKCPECTKIELTEKAYCSYSTETYLEKFKEAHPKTWMSFDLNQTVYTRSHDLVTFVCKTHGPVVNKAYRFLQRSHPCSSCSPKSGPEVEIKEYIASLTSLPIKSARPVWLDGKELDVYIPELNLAIEYNGSAYHHSTPDATGFYLFTQKPKDYHFNKWKSCFDNGVILLSIYDFYWLDPVKQEIYKAKIRHLLGLDTKIFARKCVLKDIDNLQAKDFYQANHVEGKGVSYRNSKSVGLYFEDKLLMVSTIGEYYNQSSGTFKLKVHRMCTLLDCTVVGGVSKIISYFKKLYSSDTLIYQITLSSGASSLKRFNFKLLEPRYFWVHKNLKSYFSRNYCQKQLLEKHFKEKLLPEETENQYMSRLNFIKVYDNGLAEIHI